MTPSRRTNLNSLTRISLLSLAALALACGPSKTPGKDGDNNQCQPACTGATCGQDDGCGGTCAGTCEGGLVCNAAKTCVEPEEQCTPSCATAACGDADGCGGTCYGTCGDGLACDAVSKTCKATGACPLPSSLGAMGALDGDSEGSEGFVDFYAEELNVSVEYASLYLALYADYGVFSNGLKTGTFSLSGEESSDATCGACLQIYASASAEEGMFFMPTSGSLNLTSIAGRITGSLSNVSLVEVNVDEDTGETTPVSGGCTTQIVSASFDAPIAVFEE